MPTLFLVAENTMNICNKQLFEELYLNLAKKGDAGRKNKIDAESKNLQDLEHSCRKYSFNGVGVVA